jgi:phasin
MPTAERRGAAPAKEPTMTEKTVKTAARKPSAASLTAEPFAMQSVEVPAAVREFAEKGVAQAKETYEKMKSAAEEATDVLEDTYESTRKGVVAFNLKAIDAVKANSDATFAFARDIVAVKSLSEAIELQTAFTRKAFEAMTAQAKEFQELASKLATESSAPMKDAFQKATKDFKSAA